MKPKHELSPEGRALRRFGCVVLCILTPMVAFPVCVALVLNLPSTPTTTGPGPAWEGKSRYRLGWSEAEATAFTEFPLFWVGPAIGGYNLQGISYQHGFVTFLYGVCSPDGHPLFVEGGCGSPLQIQTDHRHNPDVVLGPLQPIRGDALGAREAYWGSEISIWTGDVRVKISGQRELVDLAIQELRGFGPNASIGAGDHLSPPNRPVEPRPTTPPRPRATP